MSCSADCLILVCSSNLYLNHVNQSDSTTLKSCLVWCYTLLCIFSISVLLDASCVNGCQKLTSHWSLQIKFWPLTVCKIKFICACWTFNFKIMAISKVLFWDLGNGSLSETRASWVFNNVQQWTCILVFTAVEFPLNLRWCITLFIMDGNGILTIFEMKWLTSALSC